MNALAAVFMVVFGITSFTVSLSDRDKTQTLARGALACVGIAFTVMGIILWRHGGGA